MTNLFKPWIVLFNLLFLLAACAQPSAAPTPTAAPTATALPAATLPATLRASTPTAAPTQTLSGDLFSKFSYSTNRLHLRCDPLEIIFNVTTKDPNIKHVAFYFRMKDKATGLVSSWSNGDDMRGPENGVFQFVFQAKSIPNEARAWNAWVQIQFAALNKNGESLGRSPIIANDITYTSECP